MSQSHECAVRYVIGPLLLLIFTQTIEAHCVSILKSTDPGWKPQNVAKYGERISPIFYAFMQPIHRRNIKKKQRQWLCPELSIYCSMIKFEFMFTCLTISLNLDRLNFNFPHNSLLVHIIIFALLPGIYRKINWMERTGTLSNALGWCMRYRWNWKTTLCRD